jgi:xanthine dehydrogenase YagS FAD-binding subunit
MKTLHAFTYVNAKTLSEASSAMAAGAWAMAGGTDALHTMRFSVLPDAMYPKTVVNLKTISPSLDYIKEESGMLKIGACARLYDIAKNATVQSKYAAVAQAASKVASPHIREMGTIGGNICQLVRCWYFRYPGNRFFCIRKGGNMCYAMAGENRYHSIFGAIQACVAVNPSDIAPVLVAMNASIVTTKQTISAEKFWSVAVPGATALAAGEIVTEIQLPTPASGVKTAFTKFAIRTSVDFPIVNCAAMISSSDARICLNAVFNNPYRVTAAENAVKGKAIDDTSAAAAGTAAVQGAQPLAKNKWMVQVANAMVKKTVLACK